MINKALNRGSKFFRNGLLNHREFEQGKSTLKSRPIWMQIEPSTLCNLHCIMCRSEKVEDCREAFMAYEVFERIYKSGWLEYLQLLEMSGWGETFLNPQITMFLKKCRQFKNLTVQITTNGLLLDKKLIDVLCSLNKVNLIFSIDSSDRNVYEKIRAGACWERLIKNINLLNLARQKRKCILTTECHCLVNRLNINKLNDMVDFAVKYKFKALVFLRVHNCKQLEVADETALPVLSRALLYARSKNLLCSTYGKFNYRKQSAGSKDRMAWRCIRPWKHILVMQNGEVVPCCYLANKRFNAVLGNVMSEPLDKIWNSAQYNAFRRSATNGFPASCRQAIGCKSKTDFIPNVKAQAV